MANEQLTALLKKHAPNFSRVVPYSSNDKLLQMDFSEKNQTLTPAIYNDIDSFSHYVNEQLHTANAKFGVGGYDELRKVYEFSKVFDDADEPRRLHLGIDIWGHVDTPVKAPLDGLVHSFAFNHTPGDYGATIILSHQLEGVTFHSLYGHLSLNSIKDLQEGERVEAGDIIAGFGIPIENGHWPPHLHFQIIVDLEGKEGDYPGVCKYSERGKYLDNCPDADLILNMMQYAVKGEPVF
jgi:murein DD-endopeptidase MepM/ murein hydrolase activator NlpD